MKPYSDVEVLALRGMLCKLDCAHLQYVGQFGTIDEVLEMSSRVLMSSQSIFDVAPPMDREINC